MKSKADTFAGSFIKGFLSASSGINFINSYIFVTISCHSFGVKTFFPSESADTLVGSVVVAEGSVVVAGGSVVSAGGSGVVAGGSVYS